MADMLWSRQWWVSGDILWAKVNSVGEIDLESLAVLKNDCRLLKAEEKEGVKVCKIAITVAEDWAREVPNAE